MKIIEKEFNIQTGEETITEREETKSEKDLRLKRETEAEALRTEAEERALAKSALLNRLGISADEAALLLS
tara:strand:- start:777 stop:989 length:213 start_codon:yes stop_codon:yes gene_type:complete